MNLAEVFTLQGILLILAGIIILVIGIRTVLRQNKIRKQDLLKEGKILHSRHIEKRDKSGRYLSLNYYEMRVEYMDNGHRTQKSLKSADEYLDGDRIRLIKAPDAGNEVYIYENEKAYGLGAWVWIISGTAVVLLPFIRAAFGDACVAAVEAVFLLLVGIGLVLAYMKKSKKPIERIPAELVDILRWQNNRKRKGGLPVICYYPIYEYEMDGVTRRWRSPVNSTKEDAYQTGTKGYLYWSPEDEKMSEKRPKKTMLFVGIGMLIIAVSGIYGTILFFGGM